MPDIIPIEDPDDPRIADYRDVRERDIVGRKGLFIAEGHVVLRSLLGSTLHRPLSLLIAAQRVDQLDSLIATAPPDLPVYAATQTVMDRIAGFPIHRGILALGARAPDPAVDELLAGSPADALILVLVGIANHDNIGGLFRNAAAFGVDAVLLDPTCCDPLYRKAIRVSVGAALTVPFARFASGEDLVATLERHGFRALALSPAGDDELRSIEPARKTALIVGAEGPGLPDALLAQARTVRIAMTPGFDSLNVATAAAIALHHLATKEQDQRSRA